MKLLLDEDLPSKLHYRLRSEHEAVSVQVMGWRGKKNGELLKLLVEHEFAAFEAVQEVARSFCFALLLTSAGTGALLSKQPLYHN